jgi:hypothetical protein
MVRMPSQEVRSGQGWFSGSGHEVRPGTIPQESLNELPAGTLRRRYGYGSLGIAPHSPGASHRKTGRPMPARRALRSALVGPRGRQGAHHGPAIDFRHKAWC